MSRYMGALLALSLAAAGAVQAAEDAKLGNDDVLKMVDAKLPQSTVVMTIKSSPADFDTSPDAIIDLSKRGVPEAVIAAMLEKSAGAQAVAAEDQFNPEEILLIDGGDESQMRYINSTTRTAARALGFGGVGVYAVLPGPKANLRLDNEQPEFIVAVPGNAQPQNYLTLARFEPRRNGTREVSIGGGYMSYSTGIHKDRVVATRAEQLEDQSRAPKGFSLFKLTPSSPLAPGEYALVTYNSQVRVAGFFAAGGDSYFDFGVDG